MRIEDVEIATNLASEYTQLDSKRNYFDKVLGPDTPNRYCLILKNQTHQAWFDGCELTDELLNKVMSVIYTHIASKQREITEKLAAL